MPNAETIVFIRLADGSFLRRREDGRFERIATKSDRERLTKLSDSEIEEMAHSDPDHPALDELFWEWNSPEDDEAFRDL